MQGKNVWAPCIDVSLTTIKAVFRRGRQTENAVKEDQKVIYVRCEEGNEA